MFVRYYYYNILAGKMPEEITLNEFITLLDTAKDDNNILKYEHYIDKSIYYLKSGNMLIQEKEVNINV